MGDEFTHLTDSGVHMVEVGAKPDQKRRAIASGKIFLDETARTLFIRMLCNSHILHGADLLNTENLYRDSEISLKNMPHYVVSYEE